MTKSLHTAIKALPSNFKTNSQTKGFLKIWNSLNLGFEIFGCFFIQELQTLKKELIQLQASENPPASPLELGSIYFAISSVAASNLNREGTAGDYWAKLVCESRNKIKDLNDSNTSPLKSTLDHIETLLDPSSGGATAAKKEAVRYLQIINWVPDSKYDEFFSKHSSSPQENIRNILAWAKDHLLEPDQVAKQPLSSDITWLAYKIRCPDLPAILKSPHALDMHPEQIMRIYKAHPDFLILHPKTVFLMALYRTSDLRAHIERIEREDNAEEKRALVLLKEKEIIDGSGFTFAKLFEILSRITSLLSIDSSVFDNCAVDKLQEALSLVLENKIIRQEKPPCISPCQTLTFAGIFGSLITSGAFAYASSISVAFLAGSGAFYALALCLFPLVPKSAGLDQELFYFNNSFTPYNPFALLEIFLHEIANINTVSPYAEIILTCYKAIFPKLAYDIKLTDAGKFAVQLNEESKMMFLGLMELALVLVKQPDVERHFSDNGVKTRFITNLEQTIAKSDERTPLLPHRSSVSDSLKTF